MPKRSSQRFVVDASVAQAAGVRGSSGRSKSCRDFLLALLEQCHRIVFTGELRDEWKEHASPFADRWRAEMVGKKKFEFVHYKFAELRQHVNALDIQENQREEIVKDCHLIEAALMSDHRIASLDETMRSIFRSFARRIKRLKRILWVNPENDNEGVLDWVRTGAKMENRRSLGFQSEEQLQ